MKKFLLRIFKEPPHNKSKKQLIGSYPFIRRDVESVNKEVEDLSRLYKSEEGYSIELEETEVDYGNV